MKTKRVLKSVVSGLLALSILSSPTATQMAHAAGEGQILQYFPDKQRIVFSSSAATSENHDSVTIITPIGYFVDVYSSASDTTSDGQIFLRDTGCGAAYYQQEDGLGVPMSSGYCTWISVKDVLDQFEFEHSAAKRAEIQNLFATQNAYVRINSLMTLAKTTGAGDGSLNMAKVPGWNPGSRDDRVACAQIRVIKRGVYPITAANIRADLSLLSSNSSFSAARSVNGSLRCLDIYSTNFAPYSGPVIASYASTKTHQVIYSNLEVGGLCNSYGFGSGITDIRDGYYGIAINIKGYVKPNIKTNVYFTNSSGTTFSTAIEGTTLIPHYQYINQCTLASDVIIRASNNYTGVTDKSATVVSIGANATYTVNGAAFVVQYSASYPHTETDPISATATGYLNGSDGSTAYESNGADNVYTANLALKIKTPSLNHVVINQDSMTTRPSQVYSGEPLSASYTFSNLSSYNATFRLRGSRNQPLSMQESFYNTDVLINRNSVITRTSPIFRPKYTVSNILQVFGQLFWLSDSAIGNSLTKNINVIPSDVEAIGVELRDAGTNELVINPYIGQTIKPVYVYKNNTNDSVTIDASGVNMGATEFFSGGPYLIGANATRAIDGTSFTVTKNFKYLNFSTAVFLWGLRNDTSYETNGSNNVKSNQFEVIPALKAEFLAPNSNYRPGTEVVSTFKITNQSGYNGYTADSLVANLKVTSSDGTEISNSNDSFVVMAKGETLVWFKWTVPASYPFSEVYFTLDMDFNQSWFTAPFASDRVYYSSWTVSPVVKSNTPDTAFASTAPSWFNFTATVDKNKSVYSDIIMKMASWSYCTQNSDGTLSMVTARAEMTNTDVAIVPVNSPSAQYKNSQYYMKSGYGVALTGVLPTLMLTNSNLATDCTATQRMYALFPELMYNAKAGTDAFGYFSQADGIRTGFKKITSVDDAANGGLYGTYAELVKTGAFFQFPYNSGNGKRIHYTPIWFPDSPYVITRYAYDCWTPAGMLSEYKASNPININGSLYDDYYVAGR